MTAQAQVIAISPEVELEAKCLSLYEQATSLTVSNSETYAAAGELGKGLKALEKEITEYFEPLRIAAKANYDAVLKKKNDELAPVTEAMGIVRTSMNTYLQEQDRIRREEERKARIAAEEVAKKERERLEAQALKAMEKGKDEKAESLMEKAENVYAAPVNIAPVVDKTIRTAAGNITQAKDIKVTVMQLIPFLLELCEKNPGAVPNLIKVNDGPLKAFVKTNGLRAFKGLVIEEVSGVRF